jgi:hypothetical protein
VSPQARQGFGTLMIRRVLALQLEGDVVLDYRLEGLLRAISASLAAVEEREVPRPLEKGIALTPRAGDQLLQAETGH